MLPEKCWLRRIQNGPGLGTLAEVAFRVVYRVFFLGGRIESGAIREQVEGGEWGWWHWTEDTSGLSDIVNGALWETDQGSGTLAEIPEKVRINDSG